jgi:xanthine/CO dehydrogenase XdhC/CoxF family maturation factor
VKELILLLEAYEKCKQQGYLALATVLKVSGSAYRREGGRMLVSKGGEYFGRISGGCLEGSALKLSQQVIYSGKCKVVEYDTTSDEKGSLGAALGCKGIIEVLFERIDPGESDNFFETLKMEQGNRSPFFIFTEVDDSRKPATLLRKISTHYKEIVKDSAFEVKQNIEKSLDEDFGSKASLRENNYQLLEKIIPTWNLFIFGNGRDIYPIANLSHFVGMNPIIIGNLKGINKKKLPATSSYFSYSEKEKLELDLYSVAIIMNHSMERDSDVLSYLINHRTRIKYIGLLGPRSKYEEIIGESDEQVEFNNVFAPVGIDIGAVTPDEIALSIISEIFTVIKKKSGLSLRKKEAPIHL